MRDTARQRMLGVAVLLALIVGGGVWCLSELPLAPPVVAAPVGAASVGPSPAEASAAAVAAAEATAGPARARQFERDRAGPPPGIYVTLLDNCGQPVELGEAALAHGCVRLHRAEASAGDWKLHHSSGALEADGRWCWHNPGAGRYAVTVHGDACRAEFELAAGATHAVELRLPPEVLVVDLHFVRDGRLQHDFSASLRQHGEQVEEVFADRRGVLTVLLSAGSWSVVPQRRGLASNGAVLGFGEVALTVPRGRARASFELPVGGAALTVRVEDAEGRPVPDAVVSLSGCSAAEDEPVAVSCATGKEGIASWECLPAATWQLLVTGERLHADEQSPLVIAPVDRQLFRTIVVERAVRVRLALHDAFGEPFAPMAAPMPLLATGRGDIGCLRTVGKGTFRDVALIYQPVVCGPAVLRSIDRRVDGEWLLLPFDALPDEPLTIAGVDDVEFVLQVEPRAFVDLVACSQDGRERRGGRMIVQRGGVAVRSTEVVRPSRWRGYLPPGDYEVVVTDGEQRFERLVTVARRRLQLRLRL